MAGRLTFRIDDCPPEGLNWDLTWSPDELEAFLCRPADGDEPVEAPPRLLEPLQWRLKLRLSGSRLLVGGDLRGRAEAACDRCLKEHAVDLFSRIDEIVELGLARDLEAEDADELEALPVVDGRVDLGPLLAELFWLAWPYRVLCAPDCRGLCARCGADLNAGPCDCKGGRA